MKDASDHITTNSHIEFTEVKTKLRQLQSCADTDRKDETDTETDGGSTRVSDD